MQQSFVHLHTHTEYSLSDGTLRIPKLLDEVLQQQSPAIAITDLNNFYGAVKFFNKAVAKGLKPIIGAELYIANQEQKNKPFCLLLLVQNHQGYKNLSALISRAYREGQAHGFPCIQKEWLYGNTDGLIALSCGLRGDLSGPILANREKVKGKLLGEYKSLFENRFYIELSRVGHQHEEEYIAKAVQTASQYGIPVVASNDVHFMTEDDFDSHEVRVCIHEGRVLNDNRRVKRHTPKQFLRSPKEMIELFSDIPSAIENTVKIAQRCNFEMRMGEYFLPDFPVPEGQTIEQFLKSETEQGLNKV